MDAYIDTEEKLNSVLDTLSTSSKIAIDFETLPLGKFPGVDHKEAALHHKMLEVEGVSLRSEKLEPVYIPVKDSSISRIYINEKLNNLFKQDSLFIAHNMQFDAKIADYFFGARPKNKFCTLVGYWYIDENAKKDKVTLGRQLFGMDTISYDAAKNTDKFLEYVLRDAEFAWKLYEYEMEWFHAKEDRARLLDLATTLEMDFIDCLIDITLHGFCVDLDYLKRGEEILKEKAAEIEARIYRTYGKFNLNSPSQLSEKLYGIKVVRKGGKTFTEQLEGEYVKPKKLTATGAPSTDEATLAKLKTPLAKAIKEYREVVKVLNTYAVGYQKWVIDGRIYPTFSSATVVTGRLCVAKGTEVKVALESPSAVPIEEITKGQLVWGYKPNGKLTMNRVLWAGCTGKKKVIRLFWQDNKNEIGYVDVTENHPIMLANHTYKDARDLTPEDKLQGFCTALTLLGIKELDEEIEVYDLEVANVSNFIAGGVCVHNSSSAPNLQNCSSEPIYDETSGKWWIREAFCAAPGYKLIVADESQLEVRLTAHLSGDALLVAAIKSGEDIHTQVARMMLNKKDISSKERTQVKSLNFAVLYGLGPSALAEKLGISKQEAARLINQYYETFSGVKVWKDLVIKKMRKQGYLKSLLGRRRRIPEINSLDDAKRRHAENQAVNFLAQGGASDILKVAMVKINKAFKKKHLDAHIVNQVHDELVVEVKEEQAEEAAKIVKHYMEHPFDKELLVPLVVEPKIVDRWSEGK